MSLWLSTSIWIIYTLWSLVEVHGLYMIAKYPSLRYTRTSRMVTYLWVMFTVFWLSFQFIG